MESHPSVFQWFDRVARLARDCTEKRLADLPPERPCSKERRVGRGMGCRLRAYGPVDKLRMEVQIQRSRCVRLNHRRPSLKCDRPGRRSGLERRTRRNPLVLSTTQSQRVSAFALARTFPGERWLL